MRVLSGRSPRPWPVNRIVVVDSDTDASSGVAAVWLATRSKWLYPREYVRLYERDGGGWQCVGGSEGSSVGGWIAGTRPLTTVVHEGGSAVRSYTDRLARVAPGGSFTDIGWVACAKYHTPANVTCMDVNGRRITVPAHGHVLVVWKTSPSNLPPVHPHVVVMGQGGTRLTEFGPSDHFDSRTIIGLTDVLG